MRLRGWLCCALLIAGVTAAAAGGAAAGDVATSPARWRVGNGVPDGIGATLGRLFAKIVDPLDPARAYRVEALLTSSISAAAPPACEASVPGACPDTAKGTAMAYGNPASVVGPVTYLKLAATGYLVPVGPAAASELPSFEMALEGTLYAGPASQVGDTANLHLVLADPTRLLAWAASSPVGQAERSYPIGTGAGVVFADERFALFPGWLRGEVVANRGTTLRLRFRKAEILPIRIGDVTRVWLEPDVEAASASGLPEGSFLELEIGLSPFGAPSAVFEGASSSDAELTLSYAPLRPAPVFLRGDCDGDGAVGGNISDALTLLRFLFLGAQEPPCMKACDSNGDGSVEGSVLDAVYLLRYLFAGGPPPAAPFPGCGMEPIPSESTCASTASCRGL